MFRRLVERFARWISPQPYLMLEHATAELRRSSATIDLLREELGQSVDGQGQWEKALTPMERELRESGAVVAGLQPIRVKERMWDLELALEDRGWQRMRAIMEIEFSRYGLQQLIQICRLFYIKNPLIRRGVDISSYYVFGRGIEIRSENEQVDGVIQAFMLANENELGRTGLMEKERTLLHDGNLFMTFFTDPGTGDVLLRTIDACEIQDIVCDPNDVSIPWFYLRRWNARVFDFSTGIVQFSPAEGYYPAVSYDPPSRPATIAGKPVFWESPILHEKAGGMAKWTFGCPPVYPAIDWARAVNAFLEDWAKITRALARFAWKAETKGGQPAMQAFQDLLATTLATGGQSAETNPPPVTASTFISSPGVKMDPIKTSGMTTDPEQARRLVLMVCAALGLPETFFGDASAGSLATSKSLDRPTELKFLERQETWKQIFRKVFRYVLSRSAGAPAGRLREAAVTAISEDDFPKATFPSVLEHDIGEAITAIMNAATLGGFSLAKTIDVKTVGRLLLEELGVDNPDQILDAMYPPGSYDPKVSDEPAPQPASPVASPEQAAAAEAALKEALKRYAAAHNVAA